MPIEFCLDYRPNRSNAHCKTFPDSNKTLRRQAHSRKKLFKNSTTRFGICVLPCWAKNKRQLAVPKTVNARQSRCINASKPLFLEMPVYSSFRCDSLTTSNFSRPTKYSRAHSTRNGRQASQSAFGPP